MCANATSMLFTSLLTDVKFTTENESALGACLLPFSLSVESILVGLPDVWPNCQRDTQIAKMISYDF